jgi:hypothetical protein
MVGLQLLVYLRQPVEVGEYLANPGVAPRYPGRGE